MTLVNRHVAQDSILVFGGRLTICQLRKSGYNWIAF